jgi:hypothetical protein
MIDGKRVVAWTPYGREATVSILAQYMLREHERGIVDEWWLCMNTDVDQVDDLVFAMKLDLMQGESKWIKRLERPEHCPRLTPKQRNTGYFYRYMTDPDTVFVRFDDDIVYVHEDAIERLVRHRLEVQEGVLSFPVMWNNSIISWYAQQAGIIPRELGVVGGPHCMDPMGWANGQFAVSIHELLLGSLEAGEDGSKFFLYQDFSLPVGTQFSVSVFASLGSMYANLEEPGVLQPSEEESWHTVHQPKRIGVPNMIVGNALVSHYTFFPQGPIVRATNILDRYRSLAKELT